MNAVPSQFNDTHRTGCGRGRAFSMTELLVVMAIIAVLAGILLVALKGVRERALATLTRATMQEFSKACDSFQIEHGRYPGIIPEGLLAANYKLSGTENAILDMMGGVVRGDHPDYLGFTEFDGWEEIVVNSETLLGKIKVKLSLIGNGPEINGTPYSPYFTPKGDELAILSGRQATPPGGPGFETAEPLPDLVDAWGQPIIYVRRVRPVGDLAGVDDSNNPQFMLGTMRPYIDSDRLGELGRNQRGSEKGSIIFLAGNDDEKSAIFAQILRHPSFGVSNESLTGTARGAYVLISAGKDGVYFSVADGPGTLLSPIFGDDPDSLTFEQFMSLGPKVIDEFDDLRLFGGG